jgi:hypothetical protein
MRKLLVFLLSVFVLSCGGKNIGKTILYEGPMDGNFKSSDILVGYFQEVKRCMGIDSDISYPVVRILDGDHVMCGDRIKEGCTLSSGLIILPKTTSDWVIKHELVHYFLLKTQGSVDPAHTSDWFWKCGGRISISEDTK